MSPMAPDPQVAGVAVAAVTTAIEQAAADLALAEEPARFAAQLEAEPEHE